MGKARFFGLFSLLLTASVFFSWSTGMALGNEPGTRLPLTSAPWNQSAKLASFGGAAGDAFGSSIAISGDTVLVGAPQATVGTNAGQGSAHVFVKPITGWNGTLFPTAKLTAFGGAAGDAFGSSVAISGDTVLVGVPHSTVGANAGQGSAYVFVKPITGWNGTLFPIAKLTAFGGAAGDAFGSSVAISGNTVLVGVPHSTVGANAGQGSAYVFVKPISGWTDTSSPNTKLTVFNGAAGDNFGSSVALSGDTALLGAPHSAGVNADQGSVYIFVEPITGWIDTPFPTAKLTASEGATGDGFGLSVTLNGDTALVGSPHSIAGVNPDQGLVYVFVKPIAGWTNTPFPTAKLTAFGGAAGEGFGSSVALRSDIALVGAPRPTVGANPGQGSAYVYVKPIPGWSGTQDQTQELTDFAGAAGDGFGFSVAIGRDTVLVGADGLDANKGAAHVFTGGTGLNFIFLPLILR